MSNPIVYTAADSMKILNKRKEEAAEKAANASQEEDKNLDYHGKIGKAFNQEPTPFRNYNPAIARGSVNAYDIQRAKRDHRHPDHEKALAVYNEYDQDFDRIAIDCVNKAIKAAGARKFESKNASYELALLNACVPAHGSADDQGAINKLKAAFRDKWFNRGYETTSDLAVFKNFIADNVLSSADVCEKGITKVINAYFGEDRLLDAIKNYAPSPMKDKMRALNADTEMQDDLRRKKKLEKEAQEAAKRGEFANRK